MFIRPATPADFTAILALNDVALAKKLDAYRAKQTKAVLDNPIPGRQGKRR